MIEIKSILRYCLVGIEGGDPRFKILDDMHILDTKTGVEFHLYDDSFKVTHGEDLIARSSQFTKEEQEILWEMKRLITDPVVAKKRQEEFPAKLVAARARFATLFETPEPVVTASPMVEPDTVQYTG